MFAPITIPFDVVMLFNVLKLKEEAKMEDVELTLGEMCNVVKNTYGDDKGGFVGGQVFRYNGFISDEGSLTSTQNVVEHLAIVTYWRSFSQHEKSHADKAFKEKFSILKDYCVDIYEIGYELLWQGTPE
jgi:hypothetical protein